MSGAAAVTRPASALISRRASSRSRCSAASGPSASPHLTAAALIRCTAAVVMTSTAGTSAMSRVGLRRRPAAASVVVGRCPGGLGDSGAHAGSLADRPAVSIVGCPRPIRGDPRGPGVQVKQHLLPPASTHLRRSPGPGRRLRRMPSGASHAALPTPWQHPRTAIVVRLAPCASATGSLSSLRGVSPRLSRRSTTSASLASTTASGSPRCGWSAPTVSRSASSASRTRCAWPPRPTSTSSRWPRWPGLRSAKLMDFGKFKYEAALKAREARKNQVNTVIKEIKLRPKIDPHDYGTKKGHVERFLKGGRQGQGDDHVPRPRAVAPRAGLPPAAAPGRGRHRAGLRRVGTPSRTAAT